MRSERATIHIRPFTPEEAVVAASWRYPGDLSMYAGDPDSWHQFLAATEGGHGYYAVVRGVDLIGFCCFGQEGRVPGQPGGGPPWWRVVRSDGRLAAPDPASQARLLAGEGVVVVEGRVQAV